MSFWSSFNNCAFSLLCSPELEKGLKKRVKLHTHENGESSRENGQNGQNGEIDSDDNYPEVSCTCLRHDTR